MRLLNHACRSHDKPSLLSLLRFGIAQQQHQALLEAMEQQSISIAKAGVVCSLPARTSIIAAGEGKKNTVLDVFVAQKKTSASGIRHPNRSLSFCDALRNTLYRPPSLPFSLRTHHPTNLFPSPQPTPLAATTTRAAPSQRTSRWAQPCSRALTSSSSFWIGWVGLFFFMPYFFSYLCDVLFYCRFASPYLW